MMKRLIMLSMMSIIIVMFTACGNEETVKEMSQVEATEETIQDAQDNEAQVVDEIEEAVTIVEEVIVPWKVFTSFYVMEDFAKKIGGERVEVTNMIPAGSEPHDWEPTAMGIVQLETADLFVYNGAGFEPWLDKITSVLENDSIVFVETAKEVTLIKGHAHSHGHDDEDKHDDDEVMDAHVWLNPLNAKLQLLAIRDALVALDPEHADYYQSNFDAAATEIDAIDLAYKEAVEAFTTKEIIVAHEAYGYLCEAYGLTQLGIEGLNSESEPTPARMAELTDYAKKKNISVIFFENLASPKVADALAREIGARTMVLSPIEGLTEEEIAAGKDYFSVMRDNLEALKEALN